MVAFDGGFGKPIFSGVRAGRSVLGVGLAGGIGDEQPAVGETRL